VTLAWAVSCAQVVYLKEGNNTRRQIASHDEEEFQPSRTTTYRLIAIGKDGSEKRQEITIKVVP
jgi:hypothetical protein